VCFGLWEPFCGGDSEHAIIYFCRVEREGETAVALGTGTSLR
jgi:hypothetical protein